MLFRSDLKLLMTESLLIFLEDSIQDTRTQKQPNLFRNLSELQNLIYFTLKLFQMEQTQTPDSKYRFQTSELRQIQITNTEHLMFKLEIIWIMTLIPRFWNNTGLAL